MKPNTVDILDIGLKSLCWSVAILVMFGLVSLLFDLFANGIAVTSFDFLINEPEQSGRAGGIGPILVSTLYIVGVAMLVSIPLGLAVAVYLAEFSKKYSAFGIFIRKSLEVLAGVPSIVFGLFGNAFFCIYLDMGFSILSGGLTLACMVLPIFIRISEDAIRNVPSNLKMATFSLGYSKTSALWQVFIPLALPGIIVGAILGFGRAIAETAALIFTSGYVDRWPESIMDSGRSLSIHIFDLAMNIPGGDKNAYGSSVVLISVILFVTLMTSLISNLWLRKRGFRT